MASSIDYVEYVCDQIANTGDVRYTRLFGEYLVYVNNKPILFVCDNTVFVKKIPALAEVMKDAPCGLPYHWAVENYILDIDDKEFAEKIVLLIEANIDVVKPKVRKKQKF